MYPALVNCTTIDWFSEWPRDALLEVAEKYLEGVDLGEVDEVNFVFCINFQFFEAFFFGSYLC